MREGPHFGSSSDLTPDCSAMRGKRKIIFALAALLVLGLAWGLWNYARARECRKNKISDESYALFLGNDLAAYEHDHKRYPPGAKSMKYLTPALIKELDKEDPGSGTSMIDGAFAHNSYGPNPGPGTDAFPNIRLLLFPYPGQGENSVPPCPRFWIIFGCGSEISILVYDFDEHWMQPEDLIFELQRCEGHAKEVSDAELAAALEEQIKYLKTVCNLK
jgi:hypothetical protein